MSDGFEIVELDGVTPDATGHLPVADAAAKAAIDAEAAQEHADAQAAHTDAVELDTSIDAVKAAQDQANAKLGSLDTKLGDAATIPSVLGFLRKLLDFAQPCQSWTAFDTGFVAGVSAPAANQWRGVLLNGTVAGAGVGGDQEVPAGYAFIPTKLFFWASAAGITGRVVEKTMLWDINRGGLTAFPGDTAIAGQIDHWTYLDFEIMTSFGTQAYTQTVNYLDWDGTQRSTSFTVPASTAVGTRIRVYPDPAGLGFRSIVSTPLSSGSGRGRLWGIKELGSVCTTAANSGGYYELNETHPIQRGTNRYMAFEMTSTATTAVTVRFTVSGCFIPGFV